MSIDTSDHKEKIWYYTPPAFFTRWRGGSYWCYHELGREALPEHVKDALEFVKEELGKAPSERSVDFEQSTAEGRYNTRKYNLVRIYCKTKEMAVQFKLSYCDQ